MHGSGLSLPKSNLRHHLKTCVATNFGWWTNGHLRLWGSVKYLCNMLCLPDCMFADDAAQSIIAFLTVVCRHTGGRYIAPEVSMHNTRAKSHTQMCKQVCTIICSPYTIILHSRGKIGPINHVYEIAQSWWPIYCAWGVNAQRKHALTSTCRAYFVCFNNNVTRSMFIELTISYITMG